jgi:hypothetical protein
VLTVDVVSLRESFGNCSDAEILAGCHYWDKSITTLDQAQEWIWTLVWWLLNTDQYLEAMTVLWSQEFWDRRPKSLQRMMDAYFREDLLVVIGGASVGKSYGLIGILLADFLRDCEFTAIRILSTTGGHALVNTFANLQRFYEKCLVPMPGFQKQGQIGLNTFDAHAGILVLATPDGSTKNQLQGFHNIRRDVEHPVFGLESRTRVFCDEAENHPHGTWEGIRNVKSNVDGFGGTKIIFAANPDDSLSQLGILAEPACGFDALDIDLHFEWPAGKSNFYILRIDPAYTENILANKNIIPGMMKVEAYREYLRGEGKDKSYYKYGRGFYFLGNTDDELIPRSWLAEFWGELWFVPNSEARGAGIDLAFSLKGDKAIMVTYRAGMAWGWTPEFGKEVTRFEEPRYAVQIDQCFTLKKVPPLAMYDQIKKLCVSNGLDMEWVAMDATGLGYSFVPMFPERGDNVMPIDWSGAATDKKIMDNDEYTCEQLFDGIVAEMYYGFGYWAVSGHVKCSPHMMDRLDLMEQLCGRRRKPSTRKSATGRSMMRLEQKSDFKNRAGISPDLADASVMAVQCARVKGPERARLSKRTGKIWTPKVDAVLQLDHIKTIDFSKED